MTDLQRIKIASLGIIILFYIGLTLPNISQDLVGEESIENVFQVAEGLFIGSNEDWELQGWPGNGTEISPYLIENMTFAYLSIENSDVFFIVQNCQIQDAGSLYNVTNGLVRDGYVDTMFQIYYCDNVVLSNLTADWFIMRYCNNSVLTNLIAVESSHFPQGSITIDSCGNVTVEGCHFIRCSWGVTLIFSNNCIIRNSNFLDCGYQSAGGPPNQGGGMYVAYCSEGIIQNNTFVDNYGLSFSIRNSERIEIIENFIDREEIPPYFLNNEECSIIDNTLSSGIEIGYSLNFNISGNELGSRGLAIYGYLEHYIHDVTSNTLLGTPLLYVLREFDSSYTNGEYGQIVVINSTRVRITKNEVYTKRPSISILYSDSCVLSDVRCVQILIDESYRTLIEHSEIIGSTIICQTSPETIIQNNTVKNGNYGISITTDSPRSLIINNTVCHVKNYGIGILSPECRVENNVITGGLTPIGACYQTTTIVINDFKAITISSDDCLIANNTVINNNGYGIWVTGKGNIIYGNTIAGNSLGNGYSNGGENQWDDGIDTGNCWGDWNLIGVYMVPGEEGCIDRFPNGYVNNSTVIGFSFSSIVILSSSIGCIAIILIVGTKIRRKTE